MALAGTTYEREIAEADDVSFELSAGLLFGLVTTPDGRAPARTFAYLERIEPRQADGRPLEKRFALTRDGRYAFGDLVAGSYRLRIEPPVTEPETPNSAWHAETIVVEAPAGRSEHHVELQRAARIHGVVLDTGGFPVDRADIHLVDLEGTRIAPGFADDTFEDGQFDLRRCSTGSFRVLAIQRRGGLEALSDIVTVSAGDTVAIEVRFED